ncbi:9920_t:CDS:2, partial [Dentiscutata heterogama]
MNNFQHQPDIRSVVSLITNIGHGLSLPMPLLIHVTLLFLYLLLENYLSQILNSQESSNINQMDLDSDQNGSNGEHEGSHFAHNSEFDQNGSNGEHEGSHFVHNSEFDQNGSNGEHE